VLVGSFVVLAATEAVLAAALLGAPTPVVYATAILVAPAFNLTRPAVNVLLPQLVRTPDELTAANAGVGWIESAGVVLGPLGASLAIALGGPGAAVAAFAVLMLVAAWAARPLVRLAPGRPAQAGESALGDVLGGLRSLHRDPRTGLLVLVLTTQSVFFGAMDVIFVVLALDELGLGNGGVGVLNAAFGVGGLLAVVLTMRLVGRRRLAPVLIGAAACMGGAIGLIAVWPHLATALVLLVVANAARSLFDVSGRTLLQRTSSPAVLGRIFGVLEGVNALGLALGALLVPVLVHVGGTTGALIGVGALMPLALILLLPIALGADARATVPVVQIALLRAMSLFRPLQPPSLEATARALEQLPAPAGHVLIREGEVGDSFYAIADGTVRVQTASGFTTTLGRGDGFGEIALLRGVPRTATVTAETDALLYRLSRDDFLTAVTGMAEAHEAARALAHDRLAEQARVGLELAP
jgi:hypothetical protein